MNSLVKIGVASALALGYVSAHAGAVIPSSSATGDVFLFADVVSSTGSVISAFAADTTVTVDSVNGTSGHLANGQTVYAADANLAALIALGSQAGNTIQWAVMGGGGDPSGALHFLTTDTATTLTSLTNRSGVNVGHWVTGFTATAQLLAANSGSNADILATSAAGAANWDPTTISNNASNWYLNGPMNQVTGLGTSATLYNVTANSAISTVPLQAAGIGNLTLTAAGLVFSTAAAAPVPLPAAIWLLGSGLLGLFGIGRRKAAVAV
jgi:hypothetical protein